MDINAFFEEVTSVPDDEVIDLEMSMEIIRIVEYSGKQTCGEVDFSAFTRQQCKRALDEVISYYPDEFSDSNGEDGENQENLLTEINRIAHLSNVFNGLKSHKPKKRFF